MNLRERRAFMRALTGSILRDALAKAPNMPDDWDGIELRHYLADKFEAAATRFGRGPDKAFAARTRAYRNEVIVRNL